MRRIRKDFRLSTIMRLNEKHKKSYLRYSLKDLKFILNEKGKKEEDIQRAESISWLKENVLEVLYLV